MSMTDRLASSPWRVCTMLGVYFCIISVMRLWLFPGVAEDDAEQLYYAQSWALGYKGSQPPAFTWLVKGIETLVGVGALALFVVKYACLSGFYVFSYLLARSIIKDRGLALFAALSPMALYYLGWDSVVNYSNSILLSAALAATLWALFRLRSHTGPEAYFVLGMAIGIGLLAKYNFVLSLLPALIAGVFHEEIRPRLVSAKIMLSVAVIIALVAPHGYWALTDPEGLGTVLNSTVRPWAEADHWLTGILGGLGSLLVGIVAFTLPASLLILGCFFRSLIAPGGRSTKTTQFFEIYFGCYILALIALVIATQATDIQNHWLMGMLPFSLYVFARLDGSPNEIGERPRKVYGGALLVVSLSVIVVLAGRSIIAPETCRKCNFFIPWQDVSSEVRAAGFQTGTIVSFDYPNQISGNLRRYFPDARVMSARFSPDHPPSEKNDGSCLLVWIPNAEPAGYEQQRSIQYANRLLGASLSTEEQANTLIVPIHGSDERTITLQYILKPDGAGACS